MKKIKLDIKVIDDYKDASDSFWSGFGSTAELLDDLKRDIDALALSRFAVDTLTPSQQKRLNTASKRLMRAKILWDSLGELVTDADLVMELTAGRELETLKKPSFREAFINEGSGEE